MSTLKELENSSTKKNTYLFFSHQNRIKMYVIDDFNTLLQSDKIDSKTRFSNGATLCLTILKKTDGKFLLRLELLSTGDYFANKLPKKGKIYKYWVTQQENKDLPDFFEAQKFIPKNTELDASSIQRVFKFDPTTLNENEPYYCFFVRHGYALHNDKKFRGDNYRKNTELTTNEFMNQEERLRKLKLTSPQEITEKPNEDGNDDDVEEDIFENNKSGVQQAEEAGATFSKIMDEKNITQIDVVAASDLLRTHQTAQYFLTKLNELKPTCLESITALFIIPCLHELMEKTRDGGKSFSGTIGYLGVPLYQENKTNCTDQILSLSDENTNEIKYGRTQQSCTSITIGDRTIPIDWVFYKTFYGNTFRDGKSTATAKSCRDNHFLGLFFDLLNNNVKGTVQQQQPLQQQPLQQQEEKKGFFSSFFGYGGKRKTHRKGRKGRKTHKKTRKVKRRTRR